MVLLDCSSSFLSFACFELCGTGLLNVRCADDVYDGWRTPSEG